MDFATVVRERRSIRKFKNQDIPDENILELINLAAHAPSSGNYQMWHFLVIKNQEIKEKMSQLVADKVDELVRRVNAQPDRDPKRAVAWFTRAPVVIAVSTEKYRTTIDNLLFHAGYSELEVDSLRCRPDLQSIGAVIQTLLLAAHFKGYGGCWLTGPMVARPALEELLGIKPPRSLAAIVALGWPDQVPPTKTIRPLEEIAAFIR
ncbi:MAG TPA: hypothetical protein DCM26_02925 [Desulfotomaculum sp.]|jgi:nitroreductase|nr:hypothetical protein [Desulfotomaculum sp.]